MQPTITRRQLLKATCAAGATAATPSLAALASTRKYTMDLRCGSIGVDADQKEAIALAAAEGFESVTPRGSYLAKLDESQLAEITALRKEAGLRWGAAGLSVDFRSDSTKFETGLRALPKEAAALKRAGATRVGTWLRPCHDELTYAANLKLHAQRLRECAKVLGDHGLRFGLEYVGPKTLWSSMKYAFVHTMAETKELIAEIDQPNVGFVLDSWHWYTAHETADDLRSLTNQDIVACDLNDAPRGIPIDEQIDNRRELPAMTGVIDLKTFLGILIELGYDGPVRAEPFNQLVNNLSNKLAVKITARQMRKAFELVGG